MNVQHFSFHGAELRLENPLDYNLLYIVEYKNVKLRALNLTSILAGWYVKLSITVLGKFLTRPTLHLK